MLHKKRLSAVSPSHSSRVGGTRALCPQCGNNGHDVRRVTLESLLRPERRTDIGNEPYHVCLTPGCTTVYFRSGSTDTFRTSDLSVRFGLKESVSPRTVCYCFHHSIEGILDEILQTGRSTVLDSIKTAMKGSGCCCEYTNPFGGCCLRSVQEVVEHGFRLAAREDTSAGCRLGDHECRRAPGTAQAAPLRDNGFPTTAVVRSVAASGHRASFVAAGGSVLAAIFSSACCWLPLVLIVFGVSAAGVAGFFEAWRPYFIASAVATLGFGFYTVYFRRQLGAADSACAAPSALSAVE